MTTYDPEAPHREREALFHGLFVTFAIQSLITAAVGVMSNSTGQESLGEAMLLTSFVATSMGGFYCMTRECSPFERILVGIAYFPMMLAGYWTSALMIYLSLPGAQGNL